MLRANYISVHSRAHGAAALWPAGGAKTPAERRPESQQSSWKCEWPCVVEVLGSVAARLELSPVCIHEGSDSKHNLKGLQGVTGINCSCNLRP